MKRRVSVGILTYNRREALLTAIQSVYDQQVPETEVVVVDSNSTDGTGDAVKETFPEVKYIRLPRNLGCPSGRNHIYANCEGEYIINLDDDGHLGEGAIEKVIKVFDGDPSIGIIAMSQRFTDEPDSGRIFGEEGQEAVLFYGGVSAFRREMLDEVGYYPEDLFLYHEEAFMALRAMDAGYGIISAPDIIMWHRRLGGSDTEVGRWDYYYFRNVLLVVTRLYPGWLMVKYLFLRLVSHAIYALRRKTFHKYLLAVIYVLFTLPATLITRKPCRKETVKKYFRLRSNVDCESTG